MSDPAFLLRAHYINRLGKSDDFLINDPHDQQADGNVSEKRESQIADHRAETVQPVF